MSEQWNYSERVLNHGGFPPAPDLTLRQTVTEFVINRPTKKTTNHERSRQTKLPKEVLP